MDKSIIYKHYDIIAKHYPNLDITQLGLVIIMLGALRSTMGHEHAQGTLSEYIRVNKLSPAIQQCIDFIQREVLGTHKSKIDIDLWKKGNKVSIKKE